jgi:hypothetical protein
MTDKGADPTPPVLRETMVIVAYAAITILATYPLILHAGDAIPAGGDSWVNYWNLWWVKSALVERSANPFFAPDVHFPYGASLYFHTLNLVPAVIALPVAIAFGVFAAFNFLVFLSFLLSAYGTYRLALYVLDRTDAPAESRPNAMRLAAFVAGIIFTFSSYRYVHLLGHLDLLSTQWLPLYVLFLLKTRDEGGWRNVAVAGLMLALAMLTAAYYMVFLLVFTALVVADLIIRKRQTCWPQVLRIAAIGAVFAILVSPVLVPMLASEGTESRAMNPSFDVDRFSTDIVAFVIPSVLHPLWSRFVTSIYRVIMRPGSNVEIVAFLGFLPLTLGLIGAVRSRAMRKFWLPLMLLFAVLALGPVAHFAGKAVLPQISSIMPYGLLARLPYGDIPRVPARYVVMTILCLSIMASTGAWTLLMRFPTVVQLGVTAVLSILVVGENAVVPLPLLTPPETSFFRQIRNDPQRAGVLEVPIPDDPGVYPERMYYQTIHNKPIFGGYLARGLPPLAFGSIPGFGQFNKTLSDRIDDVVVYDPAQLNAISRVLLAFYSAGYVIIEKYLLDSSALERARRVAVELLGPSSLVHEDDSMLAFKVRPTPNSAVTAVWLDNGWSYLERLPDRGPDGRTLRWRWMGRRSRLGIMSRDSSPIRLKFVAQSFARLRHLELTLNDSLIATIPITTNLASYETPAFRAVPDGQFLQLKSIDGAESPGQDARQLSIALFRLEVVSAESK